MSAAGTLFINGTEWRREGDWLKSERYAISRMELHQGRAYGLYDLNGDDVGMTFVSNFDSADAVFAYLAKPKEQAA